MFIGKKINGYLKFRVGDVFGLKCTRDVPYFFILYSSHTKGEWRASGEGRFGIGDIGVGVDLGKINAGMSPLLLLFNPDGKPKSWKLISPSKISTNLTLDDTGNIIKDMLKEASPFYYFRKGEFENYEKVRSLLLEALKRPDVKVKVLLAETSEFVESAIKDLGRENVRIISPSWLPERYFVCQSFCFHFVRVPSEEPARFNGQWYLDSENIKIMKTRFEKEWKNALVP